MFTIMRKYQQGLLLIVTVLIIIAFAWLYNVNSGFKSTREDAVGIIYDRPISLGEYHRGLKRMQICQELGLFPLIGGLRGEAMGFNDPSLQPNFVFGTYVLRRESEALGVNPTQDEVVEAIKALSGLQTNGAFDPAKYAMYGQRLGALGFTADAIEEAVRDNLRIKKLQDLLGTTISAAPGEVRAAFAEQNQKQEVAFVRVKEEDVAKEITLGDEDLKKAFEERKETFKTDEMRKVKFVKFVLGAEQEKIEGKERAAALQKLVDQASNFVQAMAEPGAKLEDAAQKAGVTVAESPEFSRRDVPEELGDSFNVANAVFDKLTLEQPHSDAIANEAKRDGYFVVQLTGITPPKPQAFEEVKDKLAETLKRERTSEKLIAKTNELRAKLDTEIKAGKTFADAATAAGLAVEKLPAFSQAERGDLKTPGLREALRVTPELAVGALSNPVPTQGGQLIFRVENRLPVDEAAFEKEKANVAEEIAGQRADAAFQLWFAERRKAAGLITKVGT